MSITNCNELVDDGEAIDAPTGMKRDEDGYGDLTLHYRMFTALGSYR